MPQKSRPAELEEVRRLFQHAMSEHGYGFQYRALQEAIDIGNRNSDGPRSNWELLFSEVPVNVGAFNTKIDFVLTRFIDSHTRLLLICECKRANPALANWCFLKAPYVNPRRVDDPLMFETALKYPPDEGQFRMRVRHLSSVSNACHLGLELRVAGAVGDSVGEKGGNGKNVNIESAITQVLIGVNGYIEFLKSRRRFVDRFQICFIPVVFTTARLWISQANLATSDLETGLVDLKSNEFAEAAWLWYQYPISPGLKHSLPQDVGEHQNLAQHLEEEFIRSVAIVSVAGMEAFLTKTSGSEFDDILA